MLDLIYHTMYLVRSQLKYQAPCIEADYSGLSTPVDAERGYDRPETTRFCTTEYIDPVE